LPGRLKRIAEIVIGPGLSTDWQSYHNTSMFKLVAAGVVATVIAACTPTQQVELSRLSDGGGTVVNVERSGLSPANADRLDKLLIQSGFVPAAKGASATGKARLVFDLGEPHRTETVVEVPQYEQVREVRFINGQQRVFTDHQFVGYERVYVESTVFPSSLELVVDGGGVSKVVRRVSTEGECGDPQLLKPALTDVMLATEANGRHEIQLQGC
jgi:hypothetical protein